MAGGSPDRGARLTALGAEVLRHYRALQAELGEQAEAGFQDRLAHLLPPRSKGESSV